MPQFAVVAIEWYCLAKWCNGGGWLWWNSPK